MLLLLLLLLMQLTLDVIIRKMKKQNKTKQIPGYTDEIKIQIYIERTIDSSDQTNDDNEMICIFMICIDNNFRLISRKRRRVRRGLVHRVNKSPIIILDEQDNTRMMNTRTGAKVVVCTCGEKKKKSTISRREYPNRCVNDEVSCWRKTERLAPYTGFGDPEKRLA